jgi:hypothetical protein
MLPATLNSLSTPSICFWSSSAAPTPPTLSTPPPPWAHPQPPHRPHYPPLHPHIHYIIHRATLGREERIRTTMSTVPSLGGGYYCISDVTPACSRLHPLIYSIISTAATGTYHPPLPRDVFNLHRPVTPRPKLLSFKPVLPDNHFYYPFRCRRRRPPKVHSDGTASLLPPYT